MITDESLRRPSKALLVWGVGGAMALLSWGVARVFPHALEPALDGSMLAWHWALYLFMIVFNAWTEGYKTFQKSITPRVLARAQWVAENPRRVPTLAVPFFVAGFFAMQKRALIVRYIVIVIVVAVIVGMRFVPQPWRGIVDAGVVVGLGWGVVAMGVGLVRMLGGWRPDADPQLPDTWE